MEKVKFQEIDFEKFAQIETKFEHINFIQSAAMAKVFSSRNYEVHYFVGSQENQDVTVAILTAAPIFGGKKFELRFGPSFVEGKFDTEIFLSFMEYLKIYAKNNQGLILKIIPDLDLKKRFDNGETLALSENEAISKRLQQTAFKKTNPEIGYDEGEPTWHYVKDLSVFTSEKELLKSYSKDGQYSVKKTAQFGVKIRKLSFDELGDFKKITGATSERRGYNDHDLAYYQTFYEVFGNKAQFLVAEINFQTYVTALETQINKLQSQIDKSDSAKKEKQRKEWQSQIDAQTKRLGEIQPFLEKYQKQSVILAGGLFVESEDEVIYLFSGSYEEFKNFYAPFAIQHHVMTETLKKKIPLYNFYGITGNFSGNDSVLMFKQNFQGYAVQKLGAFCYYPSPTKYKLIQMAKKVLGRH
ncbi:MAG: aminoacyltransferase [Streptococcaceae bacterium]|jgi:alanine adding enzyme|nr:aminoacyltransferase [Streptococcaceae bacterium]